MGAQKKVMKTRVFICLFLISQLPSLNICAKDVHGKNSNKVVLYKNKNHFTQIQDIETKHLVVNQIISSTPDETWKKESSITRKVIAPVQLYINLRKSAQDIHGFGACFNELGWEAITSLSKKKQHAIFNQLFSPGIGLNLTICRVPIGANDFSHDWYSYNEVEDDFMMKNFNIQNDKSTLIPYIKEAQKFNSDLRIWASPWSPPAWMKWNKHYACATSPTNISEKYRNSLPSNKQGAEGSNLFIQDDKYFKAYALYFERYIQAYRNEGINIGMVMPQNEWNSCQNFPSCTWNAQGLANFIGGYLGPTMQKQGVELMLGTMERPSALIIDSILNKPEVMKYISGVGFQWAGKDALPGVRERYPYLKFYQTEQECGDGKNDWKHCVHSWELMKHYISNGVSTYLYWNMVLPEGGISRWGWSQNSLITVDSSTNTFRYNYEFYLLKHVSHFVKPGAKVLNTEGLFKNVLAFLNKDNSIVVVIHNEGNKQESLAINIDGEEFEIVLKANSFYSVFFSRINETQEKP